VLRARPVIAPRVRSRRTKSRVTGSSISANEAAAAGGIYISGTTTIINSTISGNYALSANGGGLYSAGGTALLTYTTFVDNKADAGASGIHEAGGAVFLRDTIVASNGSANCSGAVSSNGYNLDSGMSCGLNSTGDITNTNPLLGPLTENAGTLVHPLLAGSPAIDAGSCVAGITTDQREVSRLEGAGCDIGAYEWDWHEVYLPLVIRN